MKELNLFGFRIIENDLLPKKSGLIVSQKFLWYSVGLSPEDIRKLAKSRPKEVIAIVFE